MSFDSPMRLPRLTAEASVESAVDTLQAHGALILERVLKPSVLRALGADLDRWFAHTPRGEGAFFGRKTRRFSAVFAKSRTSWDLATHPFILAIVERALHQGDGGHCDAIQLNLTQAIGIEPGEDVQPPHRDDALFPFPHTFELMVNVMWTIDPFTNENGATLIAPGSNHWDRATPPTSADFDPACAPPGSAIIWLGSTLHGGGANRSRRLRRGLTLSYSLGWLAQAERLLLSIPPSTARDMPERLQRLIGYQVHRPNLGWVEERDPLEWLNGETGDVAAAQDHLTPTQSARVEAFYAARGGR